MLMDDVTFLFFILTKLIAPVMNAEFSLNILGPTKYSCKPSSLICNVKLGSINIIVITRSLSLYLNDLLRLVRTGHQWRQQRHVFQWNTWMSMRLFPLGDDDNDNIVRGVVRIGAHSKILDWLQENMSLTTSLSRSNKLLIKHFNGVSPKWNRNSMNSAN